MTQERRKSTRVTFECSVLIAYGDQGFIGALEDVSPNGCRVTRPDDWSLGNGTDVRIYLLIDMRYAVSAEARVVWSNQSHVGFEYIEPQPLPG